MQKEVNVSLSARQASGIGLATYTFSGSVLDTWYPAPRLKTDASAYAGSEDELESRLRAAEHCCEIRGVQSKVVHMLIDLDLPPASVSDAYLRLHLLSCCLVRPNEINLEGIFACLPNVAWTSLGPCKSTEVSSALLRARQAGREFRVLSVDKFPPLLDYVCPPGVRIANGATVRLGAHLAPGTTVMHAGFVNFNAGSLGRCMIEGRVSQGVVLGDGTDIGGGASTMGTLSGGGTQRVRLGERCLLGANSGLGIALGDDCIVEAGLYVTAGTKVSVYDAQTGAESVVRARDLSGMSNLIFRRNSQTGKVEAITRGQTEVKLNPQLHA